MKALRLHKNEALQWDDIEEQVPSKNTVKVKISHIALNHLDLFSYRGMAFAQRQLPIVVGAEAAGTIVSLGDNVDSALLNKRVVIYSAKACGHCDMCLKGKENLCTQNAGIYGFNLDGFASETVVVPANLVIPVPDDLDNQSAVCAPITFATVHHMLMDNAKLLKGETILVHAGGSGVGSTAILMAKHLGATVITTVGSKEKEQKAYNLGADFVINYKEKRFEREVRKYTKKDGVDVVFEHIGPSTWSGSLLSLKMAGRLVTCGSTSGVTAETNLLHLYNKQIRIIASFGSAIKNVEQSLLMMSKDKLLPVIDDVVSIDNFELGLNKLRSRNVFGKIILAL
ncbi:zinc-binding dehydrogenase [Agarilytica rhodophyticola]|uniref:zinc-binding dehydrogenase n=1 Tax=Agarilytica rhodophyticola TaxID=1737490 RepID=UPI000B34189D|nr:zinc-binding dehydrogenase [Agarilytica rhodophyticola]